VTDGSGEAKRTRNELAFREANDDIRAIIDGHEVDLPIGAFLCECGDASCRQLIRVPLHKYGEVRESPRRFLYAPSHARRDGKDGTTVEAQEDYLVVEKTGVAGQIAADHG
jgi:hypothetical protein